ncbi:uncharacterized protein LOC135462070 [Liolophura sinensis]|uniref:uncharacterized protein LOC135462070 n=1 Tax=Liolophura sinensis TaxID=3198878 RepID=UPI0031591F74
MINIPTGTLNYRFTPRTVDDINMSRLVETCLSPGVYQLVCEVGVAKTQAEDDPRAYLTNKLLLNWDTVQMLIQEGDVNGEPTDFSGCVKSLAPLFSAVERYMSGLSCEQFASQYRHLLTWTGNPQICLRCFEYLKTGVRSSGLLSLLLSTAVLERALGDLYLTRGKQCPSLLKDLLMTSELEALLGASVIRFLRVLIGPPTSLNLRNLVWHGFPAPSEIPLQYNYMLLMVAVTLGHLITTSMDADSIPHRCPVSFHQVEKITTKFSVSLSILPKVKWKHLCRNSQFILPQFLPVWEDAFDLYQENRRYGESVTLLFPLLENGLRWMFAELNHCPDRVLTAESSVLYTTFDEILARLVAGKENKLLSKLGPHLVDLLQDLMVYPEGPRFRDRLGHGEANFLDITKQQADAVWVTALALLYTFTSPCHEQQDDHAETVLSELHSYTSVFHPVSLLTDQISSLTEILSTWLSNIHYTPDLSKMLSQGDWDNALPGNALYTELLPLVEQTGLPLLQQIHHYTGLELDDKHMPINIKYICRFLLPDGNAMAAVITVLKSARISTLRRTMSVIGQSSMAMVCEAGDDEVSCSMEEIGLTREVLSECEQVCEAGDDEVSCSMEEIGLTREVLSECEQVCEAGDDEVSCSMEEIGLMREVLSECEQVCEAGDDEVSCSMEEIDMTRKTQCDCEQVCEAGDHEVSCSMEEIDLTRKTQCDCEQVCEAGDDEVSCSMEEIDMTRKVLSECEQVCEAGDDEVSCSMEEIDMTRKTQCDCEQVCEAGDDEVSCSMEEIDMTRKVCEAGDDEVSCSMEEIDMTRKTQCDCEQVCEAGDDEVSCSMEEIGLTRKTQSECEQVCEAGDDEVSCSVEEIGLTREVLSECEQVCEAGDDEVSCSMEEIGLTREVLSECEQVCEAGDDEVSCSMEEIGLTRNVCEAGDDEVSCSMEEIGLMGKALSECEQVCEAGDDEVSCSMEEIGLMGKALSECEEVCEAGDDEVSCSMEEIGLMGKALSDCEQVCEAGDDEVSCSMEEIGLMRKVCQAGEDTVSCSMEDIGLTRKTLSDYEQVFQAEGEEVSCSMEEIDLTRKTLSDYEQVFQAEGEEVSCSMEEIELTRKTLSDYEQVFQAGGEEVSCSMEEIELTRKTLSDYEQAGGDEVSCSMEEIGLMRKTLSECLHISENVLQALELRQQQLEAKQLRSRQRDTLKRLLTSVPCLSVGLRTVIAVTLSQLIVPASSGYKVSIRFQKTMLQYCENVRTCTAGHKNNWLESVELMKKFVRSLLKE